MSTQARVLEALRWTTATRFGGYLLTWSINLYVIRLLQPSDYGLAALCMASIAVVDLLSSFGQRAVLVQRPTLEDGLVRKIFGGLLLWNFTLFIFVQALVAPAIGDFYGDASLASMIRLMSVAVLLNSFVIIPTALRWREIDFAAVSVVVMAQSITVSLVVLALALRGFGAWSLIVGQFAGVLVNVAGILTATRFRLLPDFRIRGLGRELRFGGLIFTRAAVGLVNRQIDSILIGKLLGSAALGTYTVAGNVAKQPINALLRPILSVASPAFARAQQDPEEVRRYFLRAVEAIVFVFAPIIWGVGLIADDLVPVVLGQQWQAAIPLLQILCLFLPIRLPMQVLPSLLDGTGRPEASLRNAIVAAICVPVGVALGANWGLLGVMVGWTAARLVAMSINLRHALPLIGLPFSEVANGTRRSLVAGALMGAVVIAAKAFALGDVEPLERMALCVALGVVAYLVGTWVFNRALAAEAFDLLRSSGRPNPAAPGSADGDEPVDSSD